MKFFEKRRHRGTAIVKKIPHENLLDKLLYRITVVRGDGGMGRPLKGVCMEGWEDL